MHFQVSFKHTKHLIHRNILINYLQIHAFVKVEEGMKNRIESKPLYLLYSAPQCRDSK